MAQHDLIRISLSLALVVILLFAGAWLVKRKGFGKSKTGPIIDVLSSRSLGGRNHIVVMQVDEVKLVVGVTPQQISLLHTFGEVGVDKATLCGANHNKSTTKSFEHALATAQSTSTPSSNARPASSQQSAVDQAYAHPTAEPPSDSR